MNAHVYLSVDIASGCIHQVSTWSVSSVSGNVFIRPDAELLARSHSNIRSWECDKHLNFFHSISRLTQVRSRLRAKRRRLVESFGLS